ncbi:MAG: hypothetical protein QJR13_01035 [Bacillota bacterium]|nr:hypothetical protein [Bacillota bacterium]
MRLMCWLALGFALAGALAMLLGMAFHSSGAPLLCRRAAVVAAALNLVGYWSLVALLALLEIFSLRGG